MKSEQVTRVLGPLVSRKERLIGIGSTRASLEANYLLRRLVGPERFSLGLPSARKALLTASLKLLREGPARSPSLREISEADAILVLGEDLTNTAPLIALALRQSVLQAPQAIASHLHIPRWHDQAFRNAIGGSLGPLFLAVPHATHLDDIARKTLRAVHSEIARLGAAVADHIKQEANQDDSLAKEIATSLASAKRPVVISGVHSGSLPVIEAAAQVAWALCDQGIAASLSLVPPECNSFGLGLMGGISLEEVEKELGAGADTVIILENDISRFGKVSERILSLSRNTIVLDSVRHPTSDRAQFVLASGTVFESDGTFVNHEGRAQRSVRVFTAPEGIKEDWRWLRDLLISQGDREAAKLRDFSEVTALVAENDPTFKPITEIVPAQVTPVPGERIPREPHRWSGRTAVTANISIHEPKPPADPDSPLSFSMEGDAGHPPSSLIPFFWSPGWNSVQAVAKYQREVGGPLRGGDPGRRLIEPGYGARSPFGPRPEPFRKREGEFLLFTIYQIFGSEQLSAMSPPIRERIPDDFVALNQLDAARFGVQEGDKLEVTVTGFTLRGTARLELGVPEGSAGVFLRLRQDLAFPQKPYGTIRRLEEKTWAA